MKIDDRHCLYVDVCLAFDVVESIWLTFLLIGCEIEALHQWGVGDGT